VRTQDIPLRAGGLTVITYGFAKVALRNWEDGASSPTTLLKVFVELFGIGLLYSMNRL